MVVGAGDANVVRGLTVVDNVGNSLRCDVGDGIANDVPTVHCRNSRQDIGIRLEGPGASGNKVDANMVERNGLAGIAAHRTELGDPTNDANTISDNTVAHNGVGVGGDGVAMLPNGSLGSVVRSSANTVRGNTVTGNTTDGIHVPVGSRGNDLVTNQGSGNVR